MSMATQKKRITILGSTGSIGLSSLSVIDALHDRFELIAASAQSNWQQLAIQARKYRLKRVLLTDPAHLAELKEALAEVKTLRGLIPICSSCKKIRDDKGTWNRIESYIAAHSEAEFTHGICPQCIRELYPEIADEVTEEE